MCIGKLTIIEEIRKKNKNKQYLCLCQCGRKVIKTKRQLQTNGGRQCKFCLYESLRHGLEYVKKYFLDHGCILLEDKYVNANTKMRYICNCGKERKITFSCFKNGHRCKSCGYNKRDQSGCRNHMWNPDRNDILSRARFRTICKNLIYRSLRGLYCDKTSSTYALLGYTHKELIKHIENHPNWQKVKEQKWSVDHIFPIKAFTDYGIRDLKIINSLENLQPLLLHENASKKDTYNREDFERFLNDKGIVL